MLLMFGCVLCMQGDVNCVRWDPSRSILASAADDALVKVGMRMRKEHARGGSSYTA